MADQQQRPRRQRSVKSRHTYREPDSESEIQFETLRPKSRPTRSSHRVQNYREESTSQQSDGGSSSSSESLEIEPARVKTTIPVRAGGKRSSLRRSQRSKPRHRNHGPAPPSSSNLRSFKRRKLDQRSHIETKVHGKKENEIDMIPVNTDAPPWQILEYHILLKIFQYASYPLYESALRSRPSIEWLLGISRLSKSFYDAAVAALLWEPPLLPQARGHGLLALLSRDQQSLATNYRTKIRSLNLEVKTLLVKKKGIILEDLLKFTPLLSHLRIYHWHDEMIGKAIWAEPVVSGFKWAYGKIFDCLDQFDIRLKSFEWNGRFLDTLESMDNAHHRPCLMSLNEITIVNFNFGEKLEDERLRARKTLCTVLTQLPHLECIEFRNCTILDTYAMTQLPLGLKSLSIVNCLSLTSDAMVSYLTSAGSDLLSLHLEGNQVMDLAFMPTLAHTCPHLEHLHIDLSYEDCSSYHDRNPLYDDLLPNGSPTWPSSLISVVVGPLRSLDVTDAEAFYSSLIESASNLPYLRYLSIKTFLTHASWRDRASLRTKWRPLFEKVFAMNKTYAPTISKPKQVVSGKSHRKSARLQEQEEATTSDEPDQGDDSVPGLSALPRQNRCELVEFELSDQRPTQEQFREDDFLDSEPSGDDEWTGRDHSPAGVRYAW